MNRVTVKDPTKGLQWAFFLTRDSMEETFPESAIGRARWLCFDSSKYSTAAFTNVNALIKALAACTIAGTVNGPVNGPRGPAHPGADGG